MATIATLLVELAANTAKFSTDMQRATNTLTGFQRTAQNVGSTLKNFAQFAGVALSVGMVTSALKGVIDSAAESQEVMNRLQFTMENLGYSWEKASGLVQGFADEMQKTTRYSDEQAIEALNQMFLYTEKYSEATKGATLAMDLAVRTGMDLHGATTMIGMAMSGNVERLGRYLPQLKNLDEILGKNATQAEKAAYAMALIQEKVGGAAANDINTYRGALAQFTNEWDNLKETLGTGLLPVMIKVLQTLREMVTEITGFDEKKASRGLVEKEMKKYEALVQESMGKIEGGGLSMYRKRLEEKDLELRMEKLHELRMAYDRLMQKEKELAEFEKKKTGAVRTGEDAKAAEELQKIIDKMNADNAAAAGAYAEEQFRLLEDMQKDFNARILKEMEEANRLKEQMLAENNAAEVKLAEDRISELERIQSMLNEETRRNLEENARLHEQMIADSSAMYGQIAQEAIDQLDKMQADMVSMARTNIRTIEETNRKIRESARPSQTAIEDLRKEQEEMMKLFTEMGRSRDEIEAVWKYYSGKILDLKLEERFGVLRDILGRISSTWGDVFVNMTDRTRGFVETVKDSFESLAKSVIHEIVRMTTQWMIFASVQAAFGARTAKTLFPGGPGIIASLFSGIGFAEGGMVTRPTRAIIGERGPEAVVPLRNGAIPVEGAKRNIYNIYNINALDPQLFEEYVRRNPGPFLREVGRDARAGGAMARLP